MISTPDKSTLPPHAGHLPSLASPFELAKAKEVPLLTDAAKEAARPKTSKTVRLMKEPIDIYRWRPVLTPCSKGPSLDSTLTHWIYVEGTKDSADGQPWHTSLIWSVSSSNLIHTRSGSTYRLVGPPHMEKQWPKAMCDAFYDGFPRREWIILMAQEARRQGYFNDEKGLSTKDAQEADRTDVPEHNRQKKTEGKGVVNDPAVSSSQSNKQSKRTGSKIGEGEEVKGEQSAMSSQCPSGPALLSSKGQLDTAEPIAPPPTQVGEVAMKATEDSILAKSGTVKGDESLTVAVALDLEPVAGSSSTVPGEMPTEVTSTTTTGESSLDDPVAEVSRPNKPKRTAKTASQKRHAKSHTLLKELAGLRRSKLGILAVVDDAIQESMCWDPEEANEPRLEGETRRQTRSRMQASTSSSDSSTVKTLEEVAGEEEKEPTRSRRSPKRKRISSGDDEVVEERGHPKAIQASETGERMATPQQRRRSKRVGKWWQVSNGEDDGQPPKRKAAVRSRSAIAAAAADQEAARALTDLAGGEGGTVSSEEELDSEDEYVGEGILAANKEQASDREEGDPRQLGEKRAETAEESAVGFQEDHIVGGQLQGTLSALTCTNEAETGARDSEKLCEEEVPLKLEEDVDNYGDTESQATPGVSLTDSPLSSPPSSTSSSPSTSSEAAVNVNAQVAEEGTHLFEDTRTSTTLPKSADRGYALPNAMLLNGSTSNESDFNMSDYVAIASDEEDTTATYASACKRRFRHSLVVTH